jgi:hypothetical protein
VVTTPKSDHSIRASERIATPAFRILRRREEEMRGVRVRKYWEVRLISKNFCE